MKENGPLISVIVPIYNAEKYLHQCLSSICRQTYENLEIILINDGSLDASKEICEGFQAEDGRVTLVNQENRGEARTRNVGLSLMKGEYVTFVDADDYVEACFIEELVRGIKEDEGELAVSSYVEERGDGALIREHRFQAECFVGKQGLFQFLKLKITGGVWNKLFSVKRIKEHNLSFAPDIKHGPDQLFIGEYLAFAKKVVMLPASLYHYRYLETSISKRAFSERKFSVSRYSWITSAQRLFRYVREDETLFKAYQGFLAYRVQDCMFLMSLFQYRDKKKEKELQKILRETSKEWRLSDSLSSNTKRLMRIACFSLPLYRLVIRFFRRKFQ